MTENIYCIIHTVYHWNLYKIYISVDNYIRENRKYIIQFTYSIVLKVMYSNIWMSYKRKWEIYYTYSKV